MSKRNLILFLIVLTTLLALLSYKNNKTNSISNNSPISYSFFVAGHTYGNGIKREGIHPPFLNKFNIIIEKILFICSTIKMQSYFKY